MKLNSPLVSAYRHSSTHSLQRLEKLLFKDVQKLIRYKGNVPDGLSENYEEMIMARFSALNELEKRV